MIDEVKRASEILLVSLSLAAALLILCMQLPR
jgi:hypothetical protein